PALRHELFLLISEQEGSKLKEPKGKESFRKIALEALRKVMLDQTGNEAIDDLYFTSFFVQ
ncbi:MAG: flagellar basal body protein FliL, partial [Gammaproteobacteria bacterium]|nr:flagellar basal body protein FliL [Gammaproteobacteria bacterium]